jgi:hypothetical protein
MSLALKRTRNHYRLHKGENLMQNYLVIIEDRIICEGRTIVSANNAAEAALIARREAVDDLIPMSPMENGSECPRIYRIAHQFYGKDVARLGDGVGGPG